MGEKFGWVKASIDEDTENLYNLYHNERNTAEELKDMYEQHANSLRRTNSLKKKLQDLTNNRDSVAKAIQNVENKMISEGNEDIINEIKRKFKKEI